jgi:two-component system alkaline phosphatase synthesis response regulator PhoP
MENEKNKILIIDDDKLLLDMYSMKFKEKGFEVVSSLGSLDALAKLREGLKPKVILLDLVMPAIDGFELLETAKKEMLGGQSLYIVLSNLGQDSDIERAKNLGADGYVVKASVTPSEVVTHVLGVIEAKRKETEV